MMIPLCSRCGPARRLRFTLAAALCTLGLAQLGGCSNVPGNVPMRPVTSGSTHGVSSELHIARSALDSGNVELATALYEKIVLANPRSVEGLAGLGDTLYSVGDFTRAGLYYRRAVAADPKAIAPAVGSASVAVRQRRFDDAIAQYRHVLTIDPDNVAVAAGLGAALDLKGDHAGAQDALHDALNRNPGDPALLNNLGLSLILGGNPREGANVLLDVTRFPGAPPQARQNLALAYGLLGNKQAAARILAADMPQASVDENLRFYALERDRLDRRKASGTAGRVSDSTTKTGLPAASPVPAPTREAGQSQAADALPLQGHNIK